MIFSLRFMFCFVLFFVGNLIALGGDMPRPLSESSMEQTDIQSTELFEKRMKNSGRFPWYSAKEKKPVFVSPKQSNESTQTTPEASDKKSELSFWRTVLWWGITFLLFIIIMVIVWAIVQLCFKRNANRGNQHRDVDQHRRRLETLPVEAREKIDDLLTAAELAMAEGNYRRVLVYYFGWLLVELDKAGRIVMQRGKTNHDYAVELKGASASVRDIYGKVMLLFERCYYGKRPACPEEILPLWERREEFLNQLAPQPVVSMISGANPPSTLPIKTILLFCLLTLACTSGCQKNWKDSWTEFLPYMKYDRSMNGTVLFQKFCDDRGQHCYHTNRSPRQTDQYDTIIWFRTSDYHSWLDSMDQEESLDQITRLWIQQWLRAKPGRTFVYIDSLLSYEVEYWNEVESDTPQQYRQWLKQKRLEAQEQETITYKNKMIRELGKIFDSEHQDGKEYVPNDVPHQAENRPVNSADPAIEVQDQPEWFRFEDMDTTQSRETVTGYPDWAYQLPSGSPVRFARKLFPLEGSETVLRAGDCPMVVRRQFGQSQFFVISSGTFVLNYPLLEKRNQILAGRFVDHFQANGKLLFYQGTRFVRPLYNDEEGTKTEESPFSVTSWTPFALFFWQLVLMTIVLCFWMFPIFGRPKVLQKEEVVEFGRHLDAYGALLEKTGNTDWVQKRLNEYYGTGQEKERNS